MHVGQPAIKIDSARSAQLAGLWMSVHTDMSVDSAIEPRKPMPPALGEAELLDVVLTDIQRIEEPRLPIDPPSKASRRNHLVPLQRRHALERTQDLRLSWMLRI